MKNITRTSQAICLLGLMMLVGCASTSPSSPMVPNRLGSSQDQATIQVLHRRLHERERTIAKQNSQIEVLASQLEDLKRIEQDSGDRRKSVRPSAVLVP